jgi:Protein of unknown function (DUF3592)
VEIWTTVRSPKVPFAFAAGFLLFGIGLTVHQIAVLRSSIAEAETVQSRVLTFENDSGPVEYLPEVELRYRLGDREYLSKTTAMSNSTTYPDAKRIVDSYSPGSQHVVHYLSGNPARIYANAGYTLDFFFGSILLLSLSALFLLLGMLMRRKFTQAEQVRWSGWLFASIGLVFLLIGSELAYSQGKAAKTQPSLTNAQVVTSRIHRYVRTQNRPGTKSNSVTLDETYYELIAEFRYSVEGRSFLSPAAQDVRKSNQINPTLAQYSSGSWHQISYDPHDPNNIHIHDWPDQVSQRTWVFVSLGLGLVFLLIGGVLIFASRSQGVSASALGSYQRRFRLRH